MIDLFAPSSPTTSGSAAPGRRYERSAATPGSTKAIVRLIYESDVRDVLPAIRVPTLVIHRRDAIGLPRRARPLPRRAHPRRPVRRAARHRQPHLGRRPGRDRRRDPGLRDRRPAGARAATRAGDRAVHRHRRVDAAGGRAGRRPLAAAAGRPQPGRPPPARAVRRASRSRSSATASWRRSTARPGRSAARIAIRDEVRELGLEIRAGLHVGEIEVAAGRHRRPRRPPRGAGLGARRRRARSSSRARSRTSSSGRASTSTIAAGTT